MPDFSPWQSVESSNLTAARFAVTEPDDPLRRGLLEVRFHSGAVYRYEGVPEWTWLDLVDPDLSISKGQWFHRAVVKEGYKYELVRKKDD